MKILGVMCVAAALASSAQADILYSNVSQAIQAQLLTGQDAIANYCPTCLDINTNYDSGNLYNQFTVGANSSLLDTLTLSLFAGDNTDSGSFTVNLYADSGNTPAGTVLDVLGTITDTQLNACDTGSGLEPAQTLCLGTPSQIMLSLSSMSISLAANTAYWIGLVADPVNSTSALWNYENIGAGTNVSGNYYANEDAFGADNSAGTVFTALDDTSGAYLMDVDSPNSTPEPASFLLLGTGALFLGVLGRKRKK